MVILRALFRALLFSALATAMPVAAQTIAKASTQPQMLTALAAAKAGDTIQLAPGTYSGNRVLGIKPSGQVTITSADPANPAVLVDLYVGGCSNLRFSGVVVAAMTTGGYISGSSALVFDRVEFRGMPGSTSKFGLWVRDGSASVQVTNSEFHDLVNGTYVVNSSGVTIADSYFHDNQSDGIQSSGSSNVLFKDNLITTSRPLNGDHPDGIQVFTSNKTVADHDITISGNIIVRGDGTATQGIFMGDNVGMPMVNVTITDNIVLGGMYHGIAVSGATGLSITGNVVAGFPDQVSWIRAVNSTKVTTTGNTATAYTDASGNAVPAGNMVMPVPTDKGAALLAAWLAKHEMPGAFGSAAKFLGVLGLPVATAVMNAAPPIVAKPALRTMDVSVVSAGITYAGTLTEKP